MCGSDLDADRDSGPLEAPDTRTLRIDLEFDGGAFEGWQRQSSARTVQGEVERGLERVLGRPHRVIGCGRTDAGVHARAMVASTRTSHGMDSSELERALDAVLPEDIGVLAVRDAPASFHAQRDAVWKWYRYRVLVARRKRPLERRRVWRLGTVPALEKLEAAARPLVGRHDFASFANRGSTPGRSTVRTLHAAHWSRDGAELVFDALGDGFLYKMVRTIVATTLQAAQTDDPAAAVAAVRDACDRSAAGSVAPAAGLTLMAVAMRGEADPQGVPDFLRRRVDSGTPSSMGGTT